MITKSMRFKMTLVLILILGSILALEVLLNNVFAEKYYIYREKKLLIEGYKKIDKIMKRDADSTELSEALDHISMETNIKMIMFQLTGDGFVVKGYGTNLNDVSRMYGPMYGHLVRIFEDENFSSWMLDREESDTDETVGKLSESDSETDQNIAQLITKGYYVTFSGDLPGKVEEYRKGLYLFGCSQGNYLCCMQIPLADIRESASISRYLLVYLGLAGIFAGGILMFLYASSFTKTIQDIGETTEEMANLNFDRKVHTNREDEIGMLGQSINRMSDQLQTAIGDLKAANLELQKDIEKKEEMEEMRKDFLSHVSHELKTPIALIQGYAEGLKENIDEDEESRDFYCDVISDEARKMNEMVRSLLNLNQIEFGGNALEMSRFDLGQMIHNKISASRILFEKKKVKLEYEPRENMNVWGDELMIEEAFSNYLSNAINHVTVGGRIRIWCEDLEKDLRLHVYNDGSPIPEEDKDKIWDKFYKVDKARTREYGGSGIGLSLVAATMQAHGTSYGFNNLEEGVDFYFDLDRNNEIE